MNRAEFELLRDMKDKVVAGDIRLSRRDALRPVREASDIRIENSEGVDLRLTLRWNPETGKKTVGVHVPGVGPICRVDVDGPEHSHAGRSHKHSLQTAACPDRNLPDGVTPRPELAGLDLATVFRQFCQDASIAFGGSLDVGA